MTSTSISQRAWAVLECEAAAVMQPGAAFYATLEPVLDVLFACTGHVLVTGAGTSRAVAQRFAHLLSCSGTPALLLNPADALHGGTGAVRAGDVLYVISKGGQSAEINQIAQIARQRGAKIIAQTENPASALAQMSDAVLHVTTRAEETDPYGMIATGSSLVNCAACDVLCVLLLERRGYTKEDFGKTHPGGAVGKKLESQENHP